MEEDDTGSIPQRMQPSLPHESRAFRGYVVSKSEIDNVFGEQKSVALSRIAEQVSPVRFGDLKQAIDEFPDS